MMIYLCFFFQDLSEFIFIFVLFKKTKTFITGVNYTLMFAVYGLAWSLFPPNSI